MKISEMNLVKQRGHSVGALAITAVDNPDVRGHGASHLQRLHEVLHFSETGPGGYSAGGNRRALKDVLELPWGFEIYSLLTRWNPLNFARPLPREDSGYKVLGRRSWLGPAGFTLVHHLMNDGHTVAGVDGLEDQEPLPAEISGVTPHGDRVPFRPIHDVNELYESLDDRVMAGFGGVAEYGITARWNNAKLFSRLSGWLC